MGTASEVFVVKVRGLEKFWLYMNSVSKGSIRKSQVHQNITDRSLQVGSTVCEFSSAHMELITARIHVY